MFEEIQIIDGNIKANIFIRNNNVYVYSNNDSFDVEKYFNILRQYTPEELEAMSRSAIVYDGNKGNKKGRNKLITILSVTYLITLLTAAMIATSKPNTFRVRTMSSQSVEMSNLKVDDIKNYIYSSPYLTEEEKEYLYNEDLLSDILDTINNDNHLKRTFAKHFRNMRIIGFVDEEEEDSNTETEVFGYYDTDYPSILFIKNYVKLIEEIKDKVAHEFVHLCQDVRGYNLIIEATAEIISYEYFNTPMYSYKPQVRLTKKLMEIIGPEPLWEYSFTGDFSLIENNVKPFLTEEEYEEFLNDLTFDYDDDTVNEPKFDSLDKLLSKLYKAKFGEDISSNKVISLIEEKAVMKRYYFNKRKIDKKNSYYYDFNDCEYKLVNLSTAIDCGLIEIEAVSRIDLEPKEAISLLNFGINSIIRSIDYSSANIRTTHIKYEKNKAYFSGTINGDKYEDVSIDELVEQGIIKVNYFVYDEKILSEEEFFERHDSGDDSLIAMHSFGQATYVDGKVFGLIPKKIFISPVNERLDVEKEESKLEGNDPEEELPIQELELSLAKRV